jgi:RNA polymerase sigma factor (sigma-70 family)
LNLPARTGTHNQRKPSAIPPPEFASRTAAEADESLMLRYAAGDIAAFDALYARHELGVWRFMLRSVRVQAVADDLLQDVWFAVARQQGKWSDRRDSAASAGPPQSRPVPSGGREPHAGGNVGASFKTWLFTMAHNRVVDYFRTLKNHARLDAEDLDTEGSLIDTLAADSGFGPVRQLESREQATALIAAIEQLPPDQRNAFLLQAEAGMNVQDIAQATGVTFETAKSRLRYARASLRQRLQEFA